jgi:hypothetical protein
MGSWLGGTAIASAYSLAMAMTGRSGIRSLAMPSPDFGSVQSSSMARRSGAEPMGSPISNGSTPTATTNEVILYGFDPLD